MKQLLAPISRLRFGDLAPAFGAYFAVAASSAAGWAPAASETAFLAGLAATVLLAATALDRRPVLPLAMLVVTAAWVLPPGASRGMAVTLLLALALASGAWLRRSELGSIQVALPLALGLQVLLRSEDLLGADVLGLAEILLPAMLTAWALAWLAESKTTDRLVAVAAASVVFAGSFEPSLASAFLILAGGRKLAQPGQSNLDRALALLGLLLLVVWSPPSALLALAATIVSLARGRIRAIAVVAGLLGGLFLAGASWSEAWRHLCWLPIVLPAAWLPGRRRLAWLAGVVMALAGARILPQGSAPAAALLLLALESDSRAWDVQLRWSAVTLGGTLLMAAYPWLRLDPAVHALARVGFAPSALAAVVMVAGLGLATFAKRFIPRTADLALVVLACALLWQLPRPSISLVGYDPVDLSPQRSRVTFDTPATPTRVLAIGASASNSLGLAAGTEIATIKVVGSHGREQSWTLEAGEDVGEWAARRADLRDLPALERPAPWVAWSVPGFFGRSFRSLHELDTEIEVVAVEIERHPGIAPDIGLRIDHLDLRP